MTSSPEAGGVVPEVGTAPPVASPAGTVPVAGPPAGDPQLPQNFAPGLISDPQDLQRAVTGAPQDSQNRFPGFTGCLQFGQHAVDVLSDDTSITYPLKILPGTSQERARSG